MVKRFFTTAVLLTASVLLLTACDARDLEGIIPAAEALEAELAEISRVAEARPAGDVQPVPAEATDLSVLPEYTLSGETDLPGNFFLSFVYTRNLIMMDGKGNVVWSKHEDQPVEGAHTGFWDFKKHVIDGKTYYSYHDQDASGDNFGFVGFAPGERVILDENFNEVKRITFEESDTVEKGQLLDGHDFLMIDLDHYFLSGYLKDTVYNHPDYPEGSSVVYSYLQEVKDGKAVWDFKSTDYPELYALTVTDGDKTADDFANVETDVPDIIHFNAMRLDEDGNLVCSFRNLSTILCLDRSKDTDQIKWKLSGKDDEFGLSESQKTSCQHYVTLDGNKFMVFDNGNLTKETRIRSYSIDPENHRASLVKTFDVPGKFSAACGSVQQVSDDLYVIGWGFAQNDKVCMSVHNFATGEELMNVSLANPNNFTYRCVYYD
ncbi:MAG: aryl-sulfate sulfotransferase [Lachnospiraceae bacterium]|nr:aryl-sulfate sulfotransferase [Lachnospiraceae bacterium]